MGKRRHSPYATPKPERGNTNQSKAMEVQTLMFCHTCSGEGKKVERRIRNGKTTILILECGHRLIIS